MKLYLFLRSIIWTSVISVIAAIAAVITAFINAQLPIPLTLALTSITFALLSPRSAE